MKTIYRVDLQNKTYLPKEIASKAVVNWVKITLGCHLAHAEVTIRLVTTEEMTALNCAYRKQNKPTNVLAFPANLPDNIQLTVPFIGDIVICPAVLLAESATQSKALTSHWAHIVVHGVLHLLGYDHIKADETLIMQREEIKILQQFGIENPYE